jgi:hypothetical protein
MLKQDEIDALFQAARASAPEASRKIKQFNNRRVQLWACWTDFE